MKCPYCNIDMVHGYLNCGNAIWSERKHKISTLADRKEKYTLKLGVPLVGPNNVERYCCPKCLKIIIDASEYENNLRV